MAALLLAQAHGRAYTAPDGSFAILIPAGWSYLREDMALGSKTSFVPDKKGLPSMFVVVIPWQDASEKGLALMKNAATEDVLEELAGYGVPSLRHTAAVRFAGTAALRFDITFGDDSANRLRSHAYMLAGSKKLVLAVMTCARVDSEGYSQCHKSLSTLAIDRRAPAKGKFP